MHSLPELPDSLREARASEGGGQYGKGSIGSGAGIGKWHAPKEFDTPAVRIDKGYSVFAKMWIAPLFHSR